MAHEQSSYRISDSAGVADRERARLLAMAGWRDARTIRVHSELGVTRGARGLVDLDLVGEALAMRGNHDSGEWWYIGIEQVTREQVDGALALVRSAGLNGQRG